MRIVTWLAPMLAAVGLLFNGVLGAFFLLVALNGASEARGGALLIAYLLLLLADLAFAVWASRWSMQKLSLRTRWPLWVQTSIAVVATLFVATAALSIGFLVIIAVGVG